MSSEILRVISGPAEGATLEVDGQLDFGRGAPHGGGLGDDAQLSRRHARLTRTPGGSLQIEDLGSTNGTFLNGKRVDSPQPLRPGDEISLGMTKLRLIGSERATAIAPVVEHDDDAAPDARKTSINPLPGSAGARSAGAGGAAATATPGTRGPADAPVLPPTGLGGAASPAAGREAKGGGRRPLVLAALLGLLIGAAIVGTLWAIDGGGSDDADVQSVSLMAQGFSTEVLDERSQQREITITMRTFEAPHEIQELRVHKFLDESRPPPQRTYDAIYTFTARNGDTLVLSAAGDVTEPRGPDAVFGQTFEQWRVVDGTGIFDGARGEGTITTAVAVASRTDPAPGSDVVKHIEGDLELPQQ